MASLSIARAHFDSYFYWSLFVLSVVFVAYFLTNMIALATVEDQESNIVIQTARDYQHIRAKRWGTSHLEAAVSDTVVLSEVE